MAHDEAAELLPDRAEPRPRRAPAPPLSPRLLRRFPPKPKLTVAPFRLAPRAARPLPGRVVLSKLRSPRFRLPLRRGGR